VPEEERRTEISDRLWVQHTDIDGRLRGSLGASGANPLDIAYALAAIRDAVHELEQRLMAMEEKLAGKA
jgi:hypothetical protein